MIAASLLLALGSSLGQTFFIALFVPYWSRDLEVGAVRFGMLYGVATLLSALLLPRFGRLLDRSSPRTFTILTCLGLGASGLLMANIRHEILLFVALFGLRFTGQGLCSLIGATLIGRQFKLSRGRALSLGGLGYPLGEALLPALTLLAIEHWGWRSCMVGVSVAGAILLPGMLWSWLPGERPHAHLGKPSTGDDKVRLTGEPEPRAMPVFEWLKDSRFLLLIPSLLVMPAAMTGILVHQARIAEARDWPLTLMASSLALFALTRIVSSLAAGPVVDKVGACRLVPLILVPLAIGMLLLAMGDQPLIVRWFFAFAGLSQGMSSNIMTAAWAEIYGPEILGAVKGRVTMLAIVGSALGPVGFGWALDQGVSVGTSLVGMTVASLLASALSYAVVRAVRRDSSNSLRTGSDPAP